jgi:hypothetical protein
MFNGLTATCPISTGIPRSKSGTQQHFKGRGLNVPDLHLGLVDHRRPSVDWFIGKLSDMYICIYMEKIYIYIYIWKTTIYIYIQKICLWKYTICIYIYTFIYKKIYRKKKRRMSWKNTIVSNIDQFRLKPIHWLLRETYQIYPPVSSNRVCWKCSHLVQCVFQL